MNSISNFLDDKQNKSVAGPAQQLVSVVNWQDEVVGSAGKIEVHLGQARPHRAISVLLTRLNQGRRELLIQQRSHLKIVGAGQWANTCCGNVYQGESYLECAKRRLKEELGIDSAWVSLGEVATMRYQLCCNQKYSEQEIDRIFVGQFISSQAEKNWTEHKSDYINSEEVAAATWLDLQTLSQEVIADAPFSQEELVQMTVAGDLLKQAYFADTKYAGWFHLLATQGFLRDLSGFYD